MENVFDYNITPQECKAIGIEVTREAYEAFYTEYEEDPIRQYYDLAALMYTRKDEEKMKLFINRLKDTIPQLYDDFYRTIYHGNMR